MQEVPLFPDSVPDELVAMYGTEARQAVRLRRSRRFRMARRLAKLAGGRGLGVLAATVGLWVVIVGLSAATLTLSAMRWGKPVLEVTALLGVAVVSSLVTASVCRGGLRRAAR